MTWDEAVHAMRERKAVRQPRKLPITLCPAQTVDGKLVEVLVFASRMQPVKIGPAARKRDDWELCTAEVA